MPKFVHDCEQCVYLGSHTLYGYGRHTGYDFYYCQRVGSLIARFGDESPDYVSRRAEHLNGNYPELMYAGLLALKKGLISADVLENF